MKKFCLGIIILNSLIIYGQTPNWIWAEQAIGNHVSSGSGIDSDSENNLYVCGYFMDSVQFGNQVLYSNDQRAYVVKYSSDGEFQWVTTFPCNNGSFASYIAIDSQDNVLVTGYFSGSLTAGNTTLSSNTICYFLVKLNLSGNILWARQPVCSEIIKVGSIDLDLENNIYMSGRNNGQASFGNLIADKIGMFIIKYDTNGNPLMVINEAGCHSYSANISEDENIYFSGSLIDTTIIGSETLYPTGCYQIIFGDTIYIVNNDLLFICYDELGNPEWTKQATSKLNDYWTYTSVDEFSNFYISARIEDTTNFWGTIVYPTGNTTPVLLKLDADGNIVWLNYGEPLSQNGYIIFRKIKIKNDYIYSVGNPYGSSTFANIIITNNTPNLNSLIFKLDLDGNGIWPILDTTNLAYNVTHDITIDQNENISICGSFEDSIHFGNHYLNSFGNNSPMMFVAKMLSLPLSAEEYFIETDIIEPNVFPNPSNGEFNITLSPNPTQIIIYNTNGELIQKISVDNDVNYNMKIERSGIYYLQIIAGNEIEVTKVIVTN